ncbi:MAG: hypothetical protein DRJ49_06370 [Thermoprotei archaeon]|nr:MAG: hypothetical protein DRJ49_06370 [Thermoprotei archaeon]
MEYFPYTPRIGQEDLIDFLEERLKRRDKYIIIQAATGFGKTPVVLATLLPYVELDYKILWTVRTGNEADRPIEELKTIVDKTGIEVFGFSFRGKSDMCLLARDMFKTAAYEDATYVCSRMRKKCKYYSNYIKRRFDISLLAYKPILYSEILKYGSEEGICPYMLQYYLLDYADVVAMSYNYILREEIGKFFRYRLNFRRAILVVDEAHNLQNINLYSDRITLGTVERAIKECEENDYSRLIEYLKILRSRMLEMYKEIRSKGEEDRLFSPEDFNEILDYALLEDMKRKGESIRRKMLDRGKRPRSSLHHLARFWLSVLELFEVNGIAFIANVERDNLILEIWDMRSGEILSDIWPQFRCVIFMSGTMKPIDAFAETVGLNTYNHIIIPSHYAKERVRSMVLTGITTRGEHLSESMRRRYIDVIKTFVKMLNVNKAVFTASYRVQEELIEAGLLDEIANYGELFIEQRGMRGDEARRLLDEFKKRGHGERDGILVAPMGGRFAEGADFPGEELEAIILVGIPFDRVTARTRKYIEYYESLYGGEKGRYYAYIVPALRRASQAMGRALRSEEDKVLIVAADERYRKYLNLLPDYFTNSCVQVSLEDYEGRLKDMSNLFNS